MWGNVDKKTLLKKQQMLCFQENKIGTQNQWFSCICGLSYPARVCIMPITFITEMCVIIWLNNSIMIGFLSNFCL